MKNTAAIARFRLGIGKAPTTAQERPVMANPVRRIGLALARRDRSQGAVTTSVISNAKREAEYIARRNGVKAPLLQVWTG